MYKRLIFDYQYKFCRFIHGKTIKQLKYHTLPQCTTLSDHLSTRKQAQAKHQDLNLLITENIKTSNWNIVSSLL